MLHRRYFCLSALLITSLFIPTTRSSAQTGNFAAVINEQRSFGDSLRSATFYDADQLASGPLFSVFVGYEAATDMEDPGTIDVDPATGDIYLTAFDSGATGVEDPASNGLDTQGDLDILKIHFATVYDHWQTNFEGEDVRTLGGSLAVGGPAPTGSKNALNLDYVTYGVTNPYSVFNFETAHSNTFVLDGSVEKIGEIKRNNGGNFFPFSLEFIDQETLLLLDDSSAPTATNTTATDHEYRIVQRVATSPGSADDAVGDHLDGGYNRGATESWNSRRIARVGLDFAPSNSDFDADGDTDGSDFLRLQRGFGLTGQVDNSQGDADSDGSVEGPDGIVWQSEFGGPTGNFVPSGHSEPESTAFYADPLSGIRGTWVTESDGGGDDVAFLEIDGNGNALGYRPHATTGNPTFFALDNDPSVDPTTNDGKADNIFVDQDTGDLIIIESGFNDQNDGIGPDHEPAVIRREVITYDNGSGQIQFGAWSSKVILNPTKTPGDSGFLERGAWTAYDSENDLVYVFGPGSGSPENPPFEMDIWVLDINSGITDSLLDLDDSVSLFLGDSFGDKIEFFSLSAALAATSVPEPGSSALLILAMLFLPPLRRPRSASNR